MTEPGLPDEHALVALLVSEVATDASLHSYGALTVVTSWADVEQVLSPGQQFAERIA